MIKLKCIVIIFLILGSCSNEKTMESDYRLITGNEYLQIMGIVNEKGKHIASLPFNAAQIFNVDDFYLIAPVDYENQYSIITDDVLLMNKWLREEKFPTPFVKGRSFHFEFSDVENLNTENDSLAMSFLNLLNIDTCNMNWDKAQINKLEQKVARFGKNKIYNNCMLGFSAVLVCFLREKGVEPIWYIEKSEIALNPTYTPICIDAKSDADLRIEKLVIDYLKGRVKDINFQLDMLVRFKKTYVRKSSYKTFNVRKCG